jgi:signal transduction histidine kinase
MIEKKKAKITINGSFPIIEADENQLNQLFSNLISNAIKYQPSDNIPEIIISHSLKDDNIEITIQDNGIGIDLQYKELIFQPFQRLHGKGEYEGSGIGLAICKKIVDRHKGTIDIESETGKGSKFIIQLPLKQNSQ